MKKIKILHIVGARPNYMKVAPIVKELSKHDFYESIIVHTGQHYDKKMSQDFFNELSLPEPDYFLDVRAGTHAVQTANVMVKLEPVLLKENPDLVLVVGDVNSTLAAAICAKKCRFKIAHIEAGLRSFDQDMPEEINRILTDRITDYHFITSLDAKKNLIGEGVQLSSIHYVGNCMIDTLFDVLKKINKTSREERYCVVTLHRPSNVDDQIVLKRLIRCLNEISLKIPIYFPIHPRTRKKISEFGLQNSLNAGINLLEPLSYIDFLKLYKDSRFVLTDSGGLQEETTALNIPCITLRHNTERPITCTEGTNILTGPVPEKIIEAVNRILSGQMLDKKQIQYWDGQASKRIVECFDKIFI